MKQMILYLAILYLWTLLLAPCVCGQTVPANKSEKAAIQRVKNLPVASLDRSLPKVSLEFFLKSEGEGAPISWQVKDCGEQTRNPTVDRGREFPECVVADMELRDRHTVTVLISVGTVKTGLVGAPALFSVTVIDPSGLVRRLPHLSDLPAELHRPQPKSPRDLPIPVGTLSLCHHRSPFEQIRETRIRFSLSTGNIE